MAVLNFKNFGDEIIPERDICNSSTPIFKYLVSVDEIIEHLDYVRRQMWESKCDSIRAVTRQKITYEEYNRQYVSEIKKMLTELEEYVKINENKG